MVIWYTILGLVVGSRTLERFVVWQEQMDKNHHKPYEANSCVELLLLLLNCKCYLLRVYSAIIIFKSGFHRQVGKNKRELYPNK